MGSVPEKPAAVAIPDRIQPYVAALAQIGEVAEPIRRMTEKGSLTFRELRDVVVGAADLRAKGRIDEFAQIVDHALAIAREMGWNRLLAELANVQGMNHLVRWQPDRAQPLFEEAVRLWAAEGVPEEQGRSLINLAQVHFDAGSTASAKRALAGAGAVAQAHHLRPLEAQTIGFLGALLFHHEARHSEASHAFELAMSIYQDLGDEAGVQKIAGRLQQLSNELHLVRHEWNGVVSESTEPLYRGEGRLSVGQAWNCRDHAALAAHLRATGFATRHPESKFRGTVADQIRQQGYVNQNTVSLTESLDVARNYALEGETQSGRQGVVFKIDRARLSEFANVYDSYASMRKHLNWFFGSEFLTLAQLVKALDVAEGGAFLERIARDTRQLVETQRDLVVPSPSWSRNFAPARWEQLQRMEIGTERLDSLYHAFRGFWLMSPGVGYYWAFRAVQQELCDVQAGATGEHVRNPGWQTSPFGYVAKTCRDREFFSTGPVPPECIVDAVIVQ